MTNLSQLIGPYSERPMYCLTHGEWGHYLCDEMSGEKCFWVTSAPPEFPDNWELTVSEPSPAELSRMNIAANDLLMDVIGVGL